MTGRNYLLLIAIDHYQQLNFRLYNPVRDADALLTVLLDRYNFKPENPASFTDLRVIDPLNYGDKRLPITIFKDTYVQCLYNHDATRIEIKKSIERLKQTILYNVND